MANLDNVIIGKDDAQIRWLGNWIYKLIGQKERQPLFTVTGL